MLRLGTTFPSWLSLDNLCQAVEIATLTPAIWLYVATASPGNAVLSAVTL